jgi:uncharacterized protein YcaQ
VKPDVLAAVRRMGALQIDTIHVVARSPYLVLWSRLGDYAPHWLDELLGEGSLFEYWSHAACFLPAEDYGLYRRQMLEGPERWNGWLDAHPAVVARVRSRIATGGAVRTAEFERTDGRSRGSWWDWKPEKRALEYLYDTGVLMVARRDPNFHRVYDLRERVLPAWDDARLPSPEAVRREQALRAVRALGVAPPRWVPDYFRTPSRGTAALLEELAGEGALVRVTLEGCGPGHGPAGTRDRASGRPETAYVHPDNLALATAAAAGALRPRRTTLLSPFDPVVWHRARAEQLFDFDYRIETYTPAARRRFGYFSLPVLHRGALVGRLDPKAHREEGRFVVRAVHLEPGVVPTSGLVTGLAKALVACAAWHGTPQVEILASDPPDLRTRLTSQVSRLKSAVVERVIPQPAHGRPGPEAWSRPRPAGGGAGDARPET